MQIALLSASQLLSGKLDEVARIANAVSRQLRLHAAPAWGVSPWSCVFFGEERYVPSTSYRLWLLDSPDVADALGYHDVDPTGHPYGRVFVGPILDNGGDVDQTANSVSVTTSHEALEMMGDAEANLWAQMPDGRLLALELCDPVESDAYRIASGPSNHPGTANVKVSNFVFPEYFSTAAGARYDHMKQLSAPWSMSRGGYQILMDGGAVSSVFGDLYPEWKRATKRHPAARTAKRCGTSNG